MVVLVRSLAPSAKIFISQCEAESAIVGHFSASVNEDVNVVRIVQRFGSAPDDGERGRDVGSPRRIRKLHVVAVNNVAQQLGPHVRHAAFDVELANEIRLHDKLGNILNFNFDALLDAVRDEDFRRYAGRRVDARTKARTTSDARPDSLQNSIQSDEILKIIQR